jgi:hypothetical protein
VPFKELRSLNLSGNLIGGCLPNQGMFSPCPLLSFLIPNPSSNKKNLKCFLTEVSFCISFFPYNILSLLIFCLTHGHRRVSISHSHSLNLSISRIFFPSFPNSVIIVQPPWFASMKQSFCRDSKVPIFPWILKPYFA